MAFAHKVVAAGLANEGDIVGLSLRRIAEVEAAQGVSLPAIYRTFLRECGRSAGKLSCDADLFYPAPLQLKHELHEMLAEVGIGWNLPDRAFVFAAYQGCQYCYFICGEHDDPPVYRVSDGGQEPMLDAESFTAWLHRCVAEYGAVYGR